MSGQKSQSNIIYPKVKIKDVAKAFWKGVRPKKWLLFVLVFSVVIANIAVITTPIFYKQFFDIISVGGDRAMTARSLVQIIIFIALLNSVFWVFYRIASFANTTFQPMVIANLKNQVYDYMMEHSYSFFTNNFVGSLVQKVNRFARAFEDLADNFTWNVLPLIVRIVSIFVVVSFINIRISVIIFIWAIIYIISNIIFSTWKLKYDLKVAEADSKTTGYLADTLTNQNMIALFNGFRYESEGFKRVTQTQAKMARFAWNLNVIMDAVQGLLSFSIEFILFYFVIRYWEQGLVTVGIFVLMQLYVLNMIHQLWDFSRVIRHVYRSYADAKEMVEIMSLPHEIKDVPRAKELQVIKAEIEFRDLIFSFNQTRKVLENINLVIKSGEKVALIGPSGAGKTTFVRLLLRLYQPTAGEILIDGQDITKISQESLRRNISMVPQDPVLFHRTLAENIAYGKPNASREEIEEVVKLAHCDEFIKDLPFGLETYVGERGIKLSGGERQRVAIARAILKNAPILILDEATSSLDSHSEMMIQDALNTLMKGKTVIVIAHRLSTIQKMDRIVVVDNGQIIEQGSHIELLNNEHGLYKKLWSLQAGGFLANGGEEEEKEDDEDVDEDISNEGLN